MQSFNTYNSIKYSTYNSIKYLHFNTNISIQIISLNTNNISIITLNNISQWQLNTLRLCSDTDEYTMNTDFYRGNLSLIYPTLRGNRLWVTAAHRQSTPAQSFYITVYNSLLRIVIQQLAARGWQLRLTVAILRHLFL